MGGRDDGRLPVSGGQHEQHRDQHRENGQVGQVGRRDRPHPAGHRVQQQDHHGGGHARPLRPAGQLPEGDSRGGHERRQQDDPRAPDHQRRDRPTQLAVLRTEQGGQAGLALLPHSFQQRQGEDRETESECQVERRPGDAALIALADHADGRSAEEDPAEQPDPLLDAQLTATAEEILAARASRGPPSRRQPPRRPRMRRAARPSVFSSGGRPALSRP